MATHLLIDWLAGFESELDLGPGDLARIVGVPPRTVVRWRRGEAYPQTEARRRLDELYLLEQDIHRSIGRGRVVGEWIHAPSRYLGGETPLAVLRQGQIEEIRGALAAADHGFSV